MNRLVIQLQQDIIDGNNDVMLLLRKARLIADKLELNDFIKWIDLELGGYECLSEENFPKYRKIMCPLRADAIQQNFSGILKITNSPIQNIPPNIKDMLQTIYVPSSITELKNVCDNEGTTVKYTVPSKIENILAQYVETMDMYRICDKSKLKAIIDHVITEILKWCSKLEKEGIFGENLIFTPEEKNIAKKNEKNLSVININSNVQIGNDNNQINNIIDYKAISNEINLIKQELKNSEIDSTTEKIFNDKINIMEVEVKKDDPDNTILKEIAISLRNIAEGIGASVIATFLLQHIDKILIALLNGPVL